MDEEQNAQDYNARTASLYTCFQFNPYATAAEAIVSIYINLQINSNEHSGWWHCMLGIKKVYFHLYKNLHH